MDRVVHACVKLYVLLDASLHCDVGSLWATSTVKASLETALKVTLRFILHASDDLPVDASVLRNGVLAPEN